MPSILLTCLRYDENSAGGLMLRNWFFLFFFKVNEELEPLLYLVVKKMRAQGGKVDQGASIYVVRCMKATKSRLSLKRFC